MSFEKRLGILQVTNGKTVMNKAKGKYYAILADIPPFGKNDMLLIYPISAAIFAAIYLSLEGYILA